VGGKSAEIEGSPSFDGDQEKRTPNTPNVRLAAVFSRWTADGIASLGVQRHGMTSRLAFFGRLMFTHARF
jgi:hypothetical protein